jgi:anti-anti-sigma factor
MSSPSFTLAVDTVLVGDRERVLVTVDGEIDVTNAADFVEAVDGTGAPRPLVLDLSTVHFVDSAGLAALDLLLGRGTAVLVLDPESPVRAAATLMGLPCHDTVRAALEL